MMFVEFYVGVKRQETFCVFSLHGLLAAIASVGSALHGAPPDLPLQLLLFISAVFNVTMTLTIGENEW